MPPPEILDGAATPCQIAAFLTALHIRGEETAHLIAFADVLRRRAGHVKAPKGIVLDTCGTGGDARGTFNISTVAAIIAAGAGVVVAKHGNRAISSRSGSADVLAQLGVKIDAPHTVAERCLNEIGFCFLFAPACHGAMKYAAQPRRELGFRTIFNIIGPLVNPANAQHQLIGIYAPELTEVFAEVLRSLGSRRALVVHGSDGLDEITTTTVTQVSELHNGKIKTYTISPEEFGFPLAELTDLMIDSAEGAAARILAILAGETGPCTDIAILNAGAALYVAEKADSIGHGCELARESIASGKAMRKLNDLIRLSNEPE